MSHPRATRIITEEEARSLLTETDGESLKPDGRIIRWGGIRVAVVECDNEDLAKLLAASADLAHTTLVLRSQIETLILERDLARHERDQVFAPVAASESGPRSGSDQAAKPPTTSGVRSGQRKIWHQT